MTEMLNVMHSDGDEATHLAPEAEADAAFPYREADDRDRGAGTACADQCVAAGSEAHGELVALTAREREVVCLIAEGGSNKIIARLLDISPKTVESHRAAAMRKLNVHSAVQLVRHAIRCRLVSP